MYRRLNCPTSVNLGIFGKKAKEFVTGPQPCWVRVTGLKKVDILSDPGVGCGGLGVSRFLLLALFLIWMTWHPTKPLARASSAEVIALVCGFAIIVFATRILARRAARLQRSRSFHRVTFAARIAILIWLCVGIYLLHWGAAVHHLLGAVSAWPVHLPAAAIALTPALAAWIGLWWAQAPVERSPLMCNIRLQLLFTIAPIVLVMFAHDIIMLALWRSGILSKNLDTVEAAVSAIVLGGVFLLAPEILRRVLETETLPSSPLRSRLEDLCRRHKLKYRDILLWRTGNSMGNAAVMGIIPRVRYILLSDLLLESMSEDQIEAVFAHEVGHVVHWHLAWYLVVMMILTLCAAAIGDATESFLNAIGVSPEVAVAGMFCVGFVVVFGFISRNLERQADVFAARTIEPKDNRVVGAQGAEIFASALNQVARLNNISVAARSWCHGSICSRMQYLEHLSADPLHTSRFDRFMRRMYASLVVMLLACGVYLATSSAKSSTALPTPAAIQQTSAALPH